LQQIKKSLEARGASGVLEQAEKLYYTDSLTGLPNRAFFVERAAGALKGAADPAVAMLDMNNFGAVNVGLADLHGVTGGRARADEVLAVAGATLGELGRAHGVSVVRLGGEEFVVLGPRDAVVEFSAAAKATLTPERLLDEAGMARGGAERGAIDAAMARMGRGGQPVADFTYGVAELRGRTLKEAVTAADLALAHGKDSAGRGSITLETPQGYEAWTKPSDAAPLEALPRPPPARTAESVAALEARLTPKERAVFREVAFKDPLTLTRSYDYVELKAKDWDEAYADGGMVVLSSARNLKQINDILGHDAGDLYLHRLGVVMRQAVNKARNQGHLDVQEPVRVASKEFLIVGRDAAEVTRLVQEDVARRFAAGQILPLEMVARVRAESAARGSVTPEGAELIGTLRAVSEPIRDAAGRADVLGALDRAFVSLEAAKLAETGSGARAKPSLAPAEPLPPQVKVLKPSDLRPGGAAPAETGLLGRLLGLAKGGEPSSAAPRWYLEDAPAPPGLPEGLSV
ncbi:MAG TPA: diguanylate cyclase, partial [Elusimicrobiota bacterium]|nr:diguanylate cyclase [Elusimicrobiota bacterium]